MLLEFAPPPPADIQDFFASAREVMRSADKRKPIAKRCATLTFVDPSEMLHFLSAAKIQLIASIRKHPDSITNIAKAIHRTRSAVRRDISEMESVGIVKTHEEINPAGHGRHKIVELVASTLKLISKVTPDQILWVKRGVKKMIGQ